MLCKGKIIYDADLGQFVIAVRVNLGKTEIYSNHAEQNKLLSYILIQLNPPNKSLKSKMC